MVEVITDSVEINKLQHTFSNLLIKSLGINLYCSVGFPGGSFEAHVNYSEKLDMWYSSFNSDNRFWNGFGINKPSINKGNSLVGEINFPHEGIDRRIAGVFAKESNGNILVLHRGKIGGGAVGVGKTLFLDNFRGDMVTAFDGNKESIFCLVGEMKSPLFPLQVSNFIHEVNRIKNITKNGLPEEFNDISNFQYTEEHSGTSILNNSGQTIINRTHGIVVNALASELHKRNYSVGNDRNRDLFTYNKNKIERIFEIKSNLSTQSLYAAVGQLLIYSIPIKSEVDLFIVIPFKLSEAVENRLKILNIKCLYFKWENNFPEFIDIDFILK